jgi:hypothetical protein
LGIISFLLSFLESILNLAVLIFLWYKRKFFY